MDISAWIALGSATVTTVVATIGVAVATKQANAARQQARVSREQTELQRKIHRDAQQPYVWVDITSDSAQQSLLKLVVCNAGPTVATNIRVVFDPPFITVFNPEDMAELQNFLATGLMALSPGRRLEWVFDIGHKFFAQDEAGSAATVTINCDGPYGACDTNQYTIRPSDMVNTHNDPYGSLHRVTVQLKALTAAVEKPG